MRGKKLIKNIAFTLIYQTIAIVVGFIIPKAIIHNYGSDVNGLINSIAQFLAYIFGRRRGKCSNKILAI